MIFLVFTATTAIFGGNKLKYSGLSGGSRVIMVAVKAVFCPKSIKTVRFLLVFDTFSMAAHWQRRCFVSDDSTGGQSPVPNYVSFFK